MATGAQALYVRVTKETAETLHRLKAVRHVPLADLIPWSIDLLNLAHEAELSGGKLVYVGPDGKDREEIRLPPKEVQRIPIPPMDTAAEQLA